MALFLEHDQAAKSSCLKAPDSGKTCRVEIENPRECLQLTTEGTGAAVAASCYYDSNCDMNQGSKAE